MHTYQVSTPSNNIATGSNIHKLSFRMDSKMEIVDGHMHLWTPETHPWLDKVRHGGHPAGNFGKCDVNVAASGFVLRNNSCAVTC